MEDLSTGAKIGLGLIILCFIFSVVLGLLMLVKNLANTGSSQLEGSVDQLLSTVYDDFDQTEVSGDRVKLAIKQFSKEPLAIVVVTGLCQDNNVNGGYNYGALLDGYSSTGTGNAVSYKRTSALERKTGDTVLRSEIESPVKYNRNTKPLGISNTEQFVRGNAPFLAELIQDETGTLIGLHFTQQRN